MDNDELLKIISERFDQMDSRFDQIDSRLERLEKTTNGIKDQVVKNSEDITKIKDDVNKLKDVQVSLAAGQEKQNKILESLSLRSLEQETDIRHLKEG